MNQTQKIQKQVHTSSILICTNDISRSFKSVTWIRKTETSKKILKKQLFQSKSQSIYNCTIFDFSSYIILQLENSDGLKREFEYGPVKLDQKILTMLQNQVGEVDCFEVKIILNKNQKYSGNISFSKKQPELFTININIDNSNIILQYPRYSIWMNYEQILTMKENKVKSSQSNSIFISLASNKQKFMEYLKKLKIYCHFGNHLNVIFDSQDLKNLFITKFLDNVYLKDKIKQHVQTKKSLYLKTPASYVQSDVNNLFASNDFFSGSNTPQVSQNVLQDLRNIVFTPKPTFQKDIRQRAFTNFQNFISNQSKPVPKVPQNLPTTLTIKQQSIEQQSESRRKKYSSKDKSHPKSHQFIFAYNRNRKQFRNFQTSNQASKSNLLLLQNQAQSQKNVFMSSNSNMIRQSSQSNILNTNTRSSLGKNKKSSKQPRKSRSKSDKKSQILMNTISTKSVSYEQLSQRNRYLQQQNKRLQQQNIKLKQRLRVFITFRASKSKQKQAGQTYNLPQFIKAKQHNQHFKKAGQQQATQVFTVNNPSNPITPNSPSKSNNTNSHSLLNRHSNSHLYGNLFSNQANEYRIGFGRASEQLNDGRYWQQFRSTNYHLDRNYNRNYNHRIDKSRQKSNSKSKGKHRASDVVFIRVSGEKNRVIKPSNAHSPFRFFKS